jgi:hypothetical protein
MAINFGILPKMLFKPREAFAQVQATATDGIILIVLFTIIGKGLNYALGGTLEIVGSISNIIAFIIVAWLVAVIAKRFDKGKGDFGATLGLLGYTTFLGLVFAIVISILTIGGIVAAGGVEGIVGNPAAIAGAGILIAIIALVYFAWSLWLVGTAVSVANDISVWNAVGTYIVAAIVVGLVEGVVISYLVLSSL